MTTFNVAEAKQRRVEEVKAVLSGDIKLSPEQEAVVVSYGRDIKKLLPTQILALRRFDPEEIAVVMELMANKSFLAPQPTSQQVFMNTEADIVLYGGAAGSGKTHALLMDALRHIEDPNFYAVYFRQNTTQLEGGLWPAAKRLYRQFGGVAHEKGKTITFPSGAKIKFSYMELEKHAEGHQGVEYSAIYWDEFTHFSWSQVSYLMTRLRSAADGDSYMKCSMNPDKTHFVYDWVKPFLDDAGFPDPKLCGKVRYYVLQESTLYGSWDRDELLRQFPLDIPQTYTFISGTIDDNPILDFIEPKYRGKLENNTPVNVARLRYGNWDAMPEGSNYFQREWTPIVERPPLKARRVRSWDLAATLPSEVQPNPDWTAGVRISQCLDTKLFYVEHVVRFRERPNEVEQTIIKTATTLDFQNTLTTIPQDPGSAGKAYCMQLLRKLLERGFRAKARSTNKDKVTRFAPFSAACEAGLVRVVRGDWNEAFFQELESFTGDGKTKDDQVDAVADGFMTLAETRHVPTPNMSIGGGLETHNPFAEVKK